MMSSTSSQEPTPNPPINLHEVLKDVAAGNIVSGRIAEISDPSRDHLHTFRSWWDSGSIPVSAKRDLIREMLRQSEDNLELDFTRYCRHAMFDEDDEVRALSIRCQWEDNSLSYLHGLTTCLQSEESPAVQEAIAVSLGTFSYLVEVDELDPESAAETQRALFLLIERGQNWMVRRRALESAAYMSRNQRVKQAIQAANESDFELERAGAIVAMGRNLDPDWYPVVVNELENEDPDIRCEAARAAGEFGNPAVIDRLGRMYEDEDEEVREVAIRAVGHIGGQQAIDALRYLDTQVPEELKSVVASAIEEARFMAESTGLEGQS
jgi:HEAT repeat protein